MDKLSWIYLQRLGVLVFVISVFLNPWELLLFRIASLGMKKMATPLYARRAWAFAACRVDECSREVMFNNHSCGHVGYHNNPSEYLATLNGTAEHRPTGRFRDSSGGGIWRTSDMVVQEKGRRYRPLGGAPKKFLHTTKKSTLILILGLFLFGLGDAVIISADWNLLPGHPGRPYSPYWAQA